MCHNFCSSDKQQRHLRDRERLSHILGVSFAQKTKNNGIEMMKIQVSKFPIFWVSWLLVKNKQQWHYKDEETGLKVSHILDAMVLVK